MVGSFTPAEYGRWSDVPERDCTESAAGVVEGDSVVFQGVDRLAVGRTLAVVLLPSALTRVVFAPPDDTALATARSSGPPATVRTTTTTGLPPTTVAPEDRVPWFDVGPTLPRPAPSVAPTTEVPTEEAAFPSRRPTPASSFADPSSDWRVRLLAAAVLLGLLGPSALRTGRRPTGHG